MTLSTVKITTLFMKLTSIIALCLIAIPWSRLLMLDDGEGEFGFRSEFIRTVRLTIGLFIPVVSLLRVTRARVIISIFGTSWIITEFVLWYLDSLSVRENLGFDKLVKIGALGFYQATFIHIAILIINCLLLVAELFYLVLSGQENNKR